MASEYYLFLNIYYLFSCSFVTTQNTIVDSRSIYDAYHINKKTYLINLSGQKGYAEFQKLDPCEDTDFCLCVIQRKQKWSENRRFCVIGIITHMHIILKSRNWTFSPLPKFLVTDIKSKLSCLDTTKTRNK